MDLTDDIGHMRNTTDRAGTRVPRLRWILAAIGMLLLVGSALVIRKWEHSVREQAMTGVCQGNLKRLALGLWQYCNDHGTLPPAYVAGPDGRLMHSWRVLILPYLDCQEFYAQYDFRQPWDSPHNLMLVRSHPEIGETFQCPSDAGARHGWCSYMAIVGPQTLWPGATTLRSHELARGSTKILLVERKQTGVLWTEPRDLSYRAALHGLSSFSPHGGRVHFALPTGRVGSLQRCRLEFSFSEENDISEWTDRYSGFPRRIGE